MPKKQLHGLRQGQLLRYTGPTTWLMTNGKLYDFFEYAYGKGCDHCCGVFGDVGAHSFEFFETP